ncbi:hypothetical protein BDV96DRAFT_561498 [Lophiotrema nucula]|uniref:Uncharacterized protein n=1 Tax=Lophiotrema nucula TaxID=690887 RepID=A0A6A5ZUT6_9PLEO|nr:hypothetical protein BDV96DRAFT_561498 [Lophiotrema nucula]
MVISDRALSIPTIQITAAKWYVLTLYLKRGLGDNSRFIAAISVWTLITSLLLPLFSFSHRFTKEQHVSQKRIQYLLLRRRLVPSIARSY